MDQDNFQKLIIALVAIAIGWLLGQGTELVKLVYKRSYIKRALLIELQDLESSLIRTQTGLERSLQIFAINAVEPTVPVDLQHRMFQVKYPEVFLWLSPTQRNSYELSHAAIDSINECFDRMRDFLGEFLKEMRGKKVAEANLVDAWGGMLKGAYLNVRSALWHVRFHLENWEDPDLGQVGSPRAEAYADYVENSRVELAKFIEAAKHLSKSDFEKTRV